MRDRWYGDHRDLIKWGGLLEIARLRGSRHILQVAYYRKCVWEQIEVGGELVDIAPKVIRHFRDISLAKKLSPDLPIEVVTDTFVDRTEYLGVVLSAIPRRPESPGIIFLDPDTGLELRSGKSNLTHVLVSELKDIWNKLSPGDVLALYQHETNKAGKPWIDEKRSQFKDAVGVDVKLVRALRRKSKEAAALPQDVAILYAAKF